MSTWVKELATHHMVKAKEVQAWVDLGFENHVCESLCTLRDVGMSETQVYAAAVAMKNMRS